MRSESRAISATGCSDMSIGMTAISRLSRAPRRRTDFRLRSRRLLALLILGAIELRPTLGETSGPAPEAAERDRRWWWTITTGTTWSISVLHDGVVDRMGLATAVKTIDLYSSQPPARHTGIIRLRGHAVGAPDDHTTDSFPVQPGQEIQWTLESDLGALQRRGSLDQGHGLGSFQFCSGPPSGMLGFALRSLSG